jgi:hypothetical protein
VKAAEVRRLATERRLDELEAGAEAIAEREEDLDWVGGDDVGEKLTHLMLAARVRRRIDGGEEAREAFRAELAAVRGVLSNE